MAVPRFYLLGKYHRSRDAFRIPLKGGGGDKAALAFRRGGGANVPIHMEGIQKLDNRLLNLKEGGSVPVPINTSLT